jgi:hypothetical protein
LALKSAGLHQLIQELLQGPHGRLNLGIDVRGLRLFGCVVDLGRKPLAFLPGFGQVLGENVDDRRVERSQDVFGPLFDLAVKLGKSLFERCRIARLLDRAGLQTFTDDFAKLSLVATAENLLTQQVNQERGQRGFVDRVVRTRALAPRVVCGAGSFATGVSAAVAAAG